MAASISSLSATAADVLATGDARAKVEASRQAAAAWRGGTIREIGDEAMPDQPARPPRPELRPPREMPRRRMGGLAGRIALLHAVAHIELNAIDLAWDLIGRFTALDWPRAFYDDWVEVANDEARHFLLLERRLNALGAAYGELPAHAGLWEAAHATRGDALARLAVVPLVLEARGLDVTPGMVQRLRHAGDEESAAVLEVIAEEEVGHVAAGWRWFNHACEARGLAAAETYQSLVRSNYRGVLKPPFNAVARRAAGMEPALYEPLTERA